LCLGACSKAEEQSAELAKELERARQEAECEKEVAEECARAAEEEKAAADLETAREESKATAADLRAQIETQRHALQERSADVQRAEAQAEDLSLNLRIAHNSLKKASEAEEALKERVAGLEAEVKAAQMKADFLNFSLQKQEKAGRELTAKLEAQRRDAETVRTHHHALQQEAAVLRASLLTETTTLDAERTERRAESAAASARIRELEEHLAAENQQVNRLAAQLRQRHDRPRFGGLYAGESKADRATDHRPFRSSVGFARGRFRHRGDACGTSTQELHNEVSCRPADG